MSAREQQHERVSVALAAVTCGRLSQAAVVLATRGRCSARADQYGVNVTESPRQSPSSNRWDRELAGKRVVLEHWGGDAEMLAFNSTLKGSARRLDAGERARVAARTICDYDIDSLRITYPDGAELAADRIEVVLRGPRRGLLRRRGLLLHAVLSELL